VEDPFRRKAALKSIGLQVSLITAGMITENSITLLKNEKRILPLNKHHKMLVTGPLEANSAELASLLGDKGFNTAVISPNTSPTSEQTQSAINQEKSADVIVIPTFNANTNNAQKAFVQALMKLGKPVVDAAMRNPYDNMAFPDVDANILTYGNDDISTRALAKALIGEVNPAGGFR
jgi:beta-N-acetylhexosaminidase